MDLYLRAFSTAIYQKFDLYYLCLFRIFLWSENCAVLVCKLCLFQTMLDLWLVLILETFSSKDINKSQFQFLVTFSNFFSSLEILLIITYFEHGQCFI